MKKLVKIVGNVFFAIVLVVLGFLVYTSVQGGSPSLFGYRMLRVISSSMQPEIDEGTCILIKSMDADELKVGDVITFVSTDPSIYGYYNTHRIYDIYENEEGIRCFVTKGDANDYPDAYDVTEDRLLGVYVREFPGGRALGSVISRLHERHVYFLVIILPLLLCLVSYVWQLGRAMGARRQEKESERDEEGQKEE